jgi:protein-disulfide isomerase
VRAFTRCLSALLLAAGLTDLGCHAQVPPAGSAPLSPDLARRVEILIRQRAHLTPDDRVTVGPREPSDVPGYDQIEIHLTTEAGKPHDVPFLLSKDGLTLAQLNKFDLSKDPKMAVSAAGRPERGGGQAAPVQIVVFDDLECPFCAKSHQQLFPALLDRYGSQVNVVYRDYPIEKHPWAMRAAIDANCVAAQSPAGYWNLVDYIHAHANDFGGAEHSLQKALDSLDQLSLDEAKKDKINTEAVAACIKKQDDSAIRASMRLGDSLSVGATPTIFINGEEVDGAYPLVDVFRIVDEALVAAGKTPPPPYKDPSLAGSKEGN